MDEKRFIRVAGEQAEVFDNQMDADKALMEATDDCVVFRPEIEGEWNEMIMLGGRPQALLVCDSVTHELIDKPYGWTCVIDVQRAVEGTCAPSGMRTRLQCPEPTSDIRESLRQAAIAYAKAFIALLQQQNKTNNSKNMRSKPGKGFGLTSQQ